MGDLVKPPPAWIRFFFYYLIIVALLICGILWIDGVTNTIVLTQGTQKALWVTLIAAVLSITVTVYKDFFSTARMYRLTGVIQKQDGAGPRDIEITTCFPPLFPIPSTEVNLAINVWEESDGKLPKLSIAQPAYIRKSIDPVAQLTERFLTDLGITTTKYSELQIKVDLSKEFSKHFPEEFSNMASKIVDNTKNNFSEWVGNLAPDEFEYFVPLFETLRVLTEIETN